MPAPYSNPIYEQQEPRRRDGVRGSFAFLSPCQRSAHHAVSVVSFSEILGDVVGVVTDGRADVTMPEDALEARWIAAVAQVVRGVGVAEQHLSGTVKDTLAYEPRED